MIVFIHFVLIAVTSGFCTAIYTLQWFITIANVPQQYLANRILGIWVNKQRMEKKAKDAGKNSSMTDAKIKLLEEIGFVWAKEKGQAAWEESFRQLQAYHEKHGNCKTIIVSTCTDRDSIVGIA